jgi:hypothetical protein
MILDDVGLKKLEEKLDKQFALSEKIFEQNRKIRRRLTMFVVASYLKLALILIPLILAAIFLPPLIKPVIEQYQSVVDLSSTVSGSKTSGGKTPVDASLVQQALNNLSADQIKEISKLFLQ